MSPPTFALLPGSPALEAGNNSTCLSTDQRGVWRPQGGACDIGAYESRGFALAKTGGDNQATMIDSAFATPLSVTLSETGGSGLPGMVITFTATGSGPSIAPPTTMVTTTDARGVAALPVAANSLGGSYTLTATARDVSTTLTFNLTNAYVITPDTGYRTVDVGVDGVSQGPLPSHTFSNVTANHTLTATFVSTCISVAGVDFTFAPAAPWVGESVTFTGTVSAGTAPITHTWNWGDATAPGIGATATHAFPLASATQTYTVTLNANNVCGSAEPVQHLVTVRPRRVKPSRAALEMAGCLEVKESMVDVQRITNIDHFCRPVGKPAVTV